MWSCLRIDLVVEDECKKWRRCAFFTKLAVEKRVLELLVLWFRLRYEPRFFFGIGEMSDVGCHYRQEQYQVLGMPDARMTHSITSGS